MKVRTLFLWLLFCCGSLPGIAREAPLEGDVIFHSSRSGQSEAIEIATKSPYSHVGIVLQKAGAMFVFEAAHEAKFTPLDEWIAHGRGAHFVRLRLRDRARTLTKEAIQKLHQQAAVMAGTSYDAKFRWSDEKLYCSELVWKLYHRALGVTLVAPRPIRSYDLSHPKVRAALKRRYGRHVPFDEPAVAPADLAASPLLEIVERN